jgi:hypothetical protein
MPPPLGSASCWASARDINPRASVVGLLLVVLAMLGAGGGCGRKTDPRPPELVAPRTVAELSLTTLAYGIALRWSRPTQYVDGSTMEDLGGFVVERSRNNEPFEELARVAVTDRGRFQKLKRFEYVDRAVMPEGTYHYRIVAFTSDGYYSLPTGAATLTWSPPPSPSPAASPAREGTDSRGKR